MSGLTTTGFERPLQADIAADTADDYRGTISGQLDLSESTVLGNIIQIHADQLALAWEALEEAYNGHDPENATDDRLVALSLLTGTVRRSAAVGSVTVTLTLEASTAFAAGALAVHALDDPTNRWVNRDALATTTAGNYDVLFISDGVGSDFVAPAGTLTVIASGLAGFSVAVGNAADATPGTDEETIEDLRFRREEEIARAGSGTVDAIRADVLALDGVLECLVEENTTDNPVGTLTPHSLRVVVWDGSPGVVSNDVIAQAIQDTRPATTPPVGTLSGNATRADGSIVAVLFERAAVVDIYVSVNIVSVVGVSIADVRAALQAAMPTAVGGDVIYHKLTASVFIPNVDDFVSLTIGIAPSPIGVVNIAIGTTQIARLETAHIVVTGDAS